jgi:alcohol dehydrogenase (cytochrome c)
LYWATNVIPVSTDTARGWLTAVDAEDGAVRWKFRAPAPIVAGVTHTAGGLVLTGDLHGNFYAFDAATGNVAYQTNLGGAIAGGVITYAVDGRQYVVAPAGNISRGTFGVLGSPTLFVMALGGAAKNTASDSAAVPTIVLPDVAAASSPNVGTDGKPVTGAVAAGSISGGEKVFQLCAACHGTRGEGGAGANLQKSKRDLAAIIAYIKAPTGTMPKLYPAPLSDAEVSAVAAYVMTLRH